MTKLTREDVLKLAILSRLKLSQEEVEKFQVELSEILGYVEMLNEIDTNGLDPTYQVTGLNNITRKDEIKEYQAKPTDLLKNAPMLQNNQFKVKKVL